MTALMASTSRSRASTDRTARDGLIGTFLLGVMPAVMIAGCAGGSSGVVGLPAADFERAYKAGLDVAAAERCGAAVDAGLVRYNLVEDAKRRGMPPEVAEKSGRAFDKTRSEFALKLAKKPDYCIRNYNVSAAQLALYQNGQFSP